ncbi:MAG: hypothetical protein QG670_719 [Thermoproteota archaeon]|nr:hypothetical protein [Thermoproteota archaeon]
MSAEIKEMLKTIELNVSQVDLLLNKDFREGKDELEALYNEVSYFILQFFPDAEKRITKLIQSVPICYSNFGIEETEGEEQTCYISYLKVIRNTLISFKKELQTKARNIINQQVWI